MRSSKAAVIEERTAYTLYAFSMKWLQTWILVCTSGIQSVFDIKDAFQAIRLTDEPSSLTTMKTPWGHYCWAWLPFGISSTAKEFQCCLHDIQHIINVVNEQAADDIMAMGHNESLVGTNIDRDHRN